MSALGTIYGIVARDLQRSSRQKSRLIGGLARPLMWLLLIGTGYNAIVRVEGGLSYHAFVFPGIVVMAALFGGMLTAIATVYDREFGMLRLMLASPAGVPVVLGGRIVAAGLVGTAQGAVVLAMAPLFMSLPASRFAGAAAALGLLVASRLRSVENFAGVINVVLFPLLFLSGALYPTAGMPEPLRVVASLNPVSYQVDLLRHALGSPVEFGLGTDLGAVVAAGVLAFVAAALLFDPEQRFVGSQKEV